MNARVLGFFLIVLLPLNAGCIVPLAVVPVPSIGNGQKVVFEDPDGNEIQADGMLIVSRVRYHRLFFTRFDEVPSNQIVAIRGGKATLPADVCPMTVGIASNDLGAATVIQCLTHNPPSGFLQAAVTLPFLLIPTPFATPSEELNIVPLLEGYHPLEWQRVRPFMEPRRSSKPRAVGGNAVVCANTEYPEEAQTYLLAVRDRLRRRHEKRKFEDLPDLRLEYYPYNKVRAFIDAELKRIDSLRCKQTTGDDA